MHFSNRFYILWTSHFKHDSKFLTAFKKTSTCQRKEPSHANTGKFSDNGHGGYAP